MISDDNKEVAVSPAVNSGSSQAPITMRGLLWRQSLTDFLRDTPVTHYLESAMKGRGRGKGKIMDCKVCCMYGELGRRGLLMLCIGPYRLRERTRRGNTSIAMGSRLRAREGAVMRVGRSRLDFQDRHVPRPLHPC